jgi:hypothetical protein
MTTSFAAMMAANRQFFHRYQQQVEAAHHRAVEAGVSQPVAVLVDLQDQAARYLAERLGVSREVIRRRLSSARRDREEAPLVLTLALAEIKAVLDQEAPRAGQRLCPVEVAGGHWVVVAGSSAVSVALQLSPKQAHHEDAAVSSAARYNGRG